MESYQEPLIIENQKGHVYVVSFKESNFGKRLMIILLSAMSVILLLCSGYTLSYKNLTSRKYNSHPPGQQASPKRVYNVALIGDSLFNMPYQKYELAEKINAQMSSVAYLNITNFSVNGAMIKDVLRRLNRALASNPDIVLLLWDSDISDCDEVAADYADDLNTVIRAVKKTNATLIVSGPVILGEGWLGLPRRMVNKGGMLDLYRDLNRNISLSHNVTYIDLRQEFQAAIPWYHMFYCGVVTIDGEHENSKGTDIVAEMFADSLLSEDVMLHPAEESVVT